MTFSDCELVCSGESGIAVSPSPADILKGLLNQLASSWPEVVVKGGEERNGQLSWTVKLPAAIFETTCAHLGYPKRLEDHAAVLEGAARKGIPVE